MTVNLERFMKLKIYITFLFFLRISSLCAQVGIGTTSPNASSMLDITSTNSGLLIPRVALVSTADVTTIASPITSLLVYNSGFAPNGYYYWNGSVWVQLAVGTNADWSLTGNSGTSTATNFIGTTDDVDIVLKRFNIRAGFIGNPVGATSTTLNVKNTTFGANSLLNTAAGYRNTAIGSNVMTANTSGSRNVAIGDTALTSNTSGIENTAVGAGALFSNSSNNSNTAVGRNALTVSTADYNTAIGDRSLTANTIGTLNTAIGVNSLFQNTQGNYNAALGVQALRTNSIGNNNVALGYQAGFKSLGNNNIFIGNIAGYNEIGNNKLYIENADTTTNATTSADNSLIYGEFDSNIVRVNGTLQISNPTSAPGYALPNVRGTNGQVLQTNGAGATSWVDSSSLSITETDPQVSSATSNVVPKWNGTTLVDGVMTDDGTNVGVGIAPSVGNKLEVNGKTKTTNFQMTNGASANYILQSDATGNASWALPNNTLSVVRTNLSTNQSLGTGGWQIINFNTVVFDLNSEFNTGTNKFVATKTGYYEVNAGFHTDNQSNTQFYSIGVRKNSGLYQQSSGNHINNGPVCRTINCIVYLNAGEDIEIYAENYQSGVNIDFYSGKTFFEVKQIR